MSSRWLSSSTSSSGKVVAAQQDDAAGSSADSCFCAICNDDIEKDKARSRLISCDAHWFHPHCLRNWFSHCTHDGQPFSCPMCRRSVPTGYCDKFSRCTRTVCDRSGCTTARKPRRPAVFEGSGIHKKKLPSASSATGGGRAATEFRSALAVGVFDVSGPSDWARDNAEDAHYPSFPHGMSDIDDDDDLPIVDDGFVAVEPSISTAHLDGSSAGIEVVGRVVFLDPTGSEAQVSFTSAASANRPVRSAREQDMVDRWHAFTATQDSLHAVQGGSHRTTTAAPTSALSSARERQWQVAREKIVAQISRNCAVAGRRSHMMAGPVVIF